MLTFGGLQENTQGKMSVFQAAIMGLILGILHSLLSTLLGVIPECKASSSS